MGFKIDSSSDPLKAPSSHRLNNQKASIPSLETLKAKDFFKLIAKEAKAQVKLIGSKDDVSDDSISDSSSSPPESPVTKQLEKDGYEFLQKSENYPNRNSVYVRKYVEIMVDDE